MRVPIVAVMEFQVLGPMRVHDDGATFRVGGPKQRAVLALLLASVGRPQSTDALLQGIYGPDADPKSSRSLHTYVSSLRRDLGVEIRRASGGYLLEVIPEAIDAVRFERGLEQSRGVVDPALSAELLCSALGLWRGRPYQDVDTFALQAEVSRLEALRIEALDARIEFDLAVGRHRELISELETLIAEYPLQEAFRAHQMVAMYRCGRQTDALRSYEQARTTLRDEVGLEPSPQLRDLQQRILEQDTALDFMPQVRLRPLPVRYTSFVGRSSQVEEARQLVGQTRLVTITGPGGVGKSSLAIEVARSLGESMQVLFVSIESQPSADPLVVLGTSMGLSAPNEDVLEASIVDVLNRQQTLVVFDGCEHAIGQMASLVDRLLSASPETQLLLTSREGLFIAGEQILQLGPLTVGPNSATNQLFYERTRLRPDALDKSENDLVSEIGERLDGLPLAVELVASRHRHMPLVEIRSWLDALTDLLSSKRSAIERHTSITASLDWTYDLLPSDLQHAFDALSVFRTGVPPAGAALVLEVDDVGPVLSSLEDVSLLGPADDDGRHGILEPIRQYGWAHLETSGATADVRRRYCHWLAELSRTIRDLAWVDRSAQSLRLLKREVAEIETTTSWAVEHGHISCALAIVAAIGRLWPVVTNPRTLRRLAMAALDHPAASVDDTYVQAMARTAWMHRMDRRDIMESLLERIDGIGFETEDPRTAFVVGHVKTVAPADHNSWLVDEQLLASYDEVTEKSVALGHPREGSLYNRAVLNEKFGRLDEAARDIAAILEWADETRPMDRGRALQAKAQYETFRGRFDTAIADATEAHRLLVDAGDLDFAAEAEYKRALAYELSNRPAEAQRALDRVDQLHRLIGLPPTSEENPHLSARIAGANDDWDRFASCMRTLISQAPAQSEQRSRQSFIEGDVSMGPAGVWVLHQTARWLLAAGRSNEAAQIVASAPMALQATPFEGWAAVGEVARLGQLATQVGAQLVASLPDLESLFTYVAECVAGGRGITT